MATRKPKTVTPVTQEPAEDGFVALGHDADQELEAAVPGKIVAPVPGQLEISLFSDDRSYGGLDKKSNKAYVRRRADVYDQPTVANDDGLVRGFQPTIPLLVNGVPFLLPPGITVVTGPTSVGKSALIRALATCQTVDLALAVEPHDDPADISSTAYFDSADAALMYLVQRQRLSILANEVPPLAVLDSLRQAVFETTGAAGEKGMVMKFFTILTRVSSSLARNGISVLVTVNPLQTDQDAVKAFIDRIKSAVPAVIELQSLSRTGSRLTFRGQVSARPDRQPRGFEFTPNSDEPHVQSESGYFEFDQSTSQAQTWAQRNSFPTTTI